MRYYEKKNHAVHALHAHVVLTPRYQRAVFTDPAVRKLAINSIAALCSNLCIALEAIEVDKDHRHLLIRYQPTLSLATIIARIKGASSRAIRRQRIPTVRKMLWGDHFWSPSYCIISCGSAPIETIRRYIEQQGK